MRNSAVSLFYESGSFQAKIWQLFLKVSDQDLSFKYYIVEKGGVRQTFYKYLVFMSVSQSLIISRFVKKMIVNS